MKAHFEMFAAYNAWANRRLFDAVGEMSETALKAPARAFWGTMIKTLGLLLVGDRAWMHRFDGEGTAATKRDFDGDPRDDLASLRATRQKIIKIGQHRVDFPACAVRGIFGGKLVPGVLKRGFHGR